MTPSRSETGSATVLAVISSGLLVGLASVLVALVIAATVRIEAETAADAAALAAVGAAVVGDDPCAAAARLAVANGGRLTTCDCPEFVGEPVVAIVVVARTVDIPLVGARTIEVERAAEYRPDT